jgi:hypothetical protein
MGLLLLHLLGLAEKRCPGNPLPEAVRGRDRQRGDADEARVEASPLGLGEVRARRDREAGQLDEHLLEARERPLQALRERPERRRATRRCEAGPRVAQERAALVVVVGGEERLDQDERLPRRELVPGDRAEDERLVGSPHAREGVRDLDAGGAAVDRREERGVEQPRQREALLDPRRLAAQEARDRVGSQRVLLRERADDPRLVQRRQRAPRRVGGEQRPLRGRRAERLHQRGSRGDPRGLPRLHALEPVDDLERAAGKLRHPDRQRRELAVGGAVLRAQRLEPRAERGERDVRDLARHRASPRRRCPGRRAASGRTPPTRASSAREAAGTESTWKTPSAAPCGHAW